MCSHLQSQNSQPEHRPAVVELDCTPIAAAAVAGIYHRSWPHSASGTFTAEEIGSRPAGRTVAQWCELLERSPVRAFATLDEASGFVVVTDEADGFELSYLFVEPEAFGTGLADALYDHAVTAAGARVLHAWILETNVRSQRFFTRRGWVADTDGRQPPWHEPHLYVRFTQPDAVADSQPSVRR